MLEVEPTGYCGRTANAAKLSLALLQKLVLDGCTIKIYGSLHGIPVKLPLAGHIVSLPSVRYIFASHMSS